MEVAGGAVALFACVRVLVWIGGTRLSEEVAPFRAENLTRFAAGDELVALVEHSQGY